MPDPAPAPADECGRVINSGGVVWACRGMVGHIGTHVRWPLPLKKPTRKSPPAPACPGVIGCDLPRNVHDSGPTHCPGCSREVAALRAENARLRTEIGVTAEDLRNYIVMAKPKKTTAAYIVVARCEKGLRAALAEKKEGHR